MVQNYTCMLRFIVAVRARTCALDPRFAVQLQLQDLPATDPDCARNTHNITFNHFPTHPRSEGGSLVCDLLVDCSSCP
jgi:hypothetical protein